MIVDHIFIQVNPQSFVRFTVTRLAMPLFFLISGHLVKRVTKRTAAIFAVGLLLPAFIPWVDSPNVLCWYALGSIIIVYLKKARIGIIIFALTWAANYYNHPEFSSYWPWSLFALMCFGSLLERKTFAIGEKLHSSFAVIGRFPLSIYVGHMILIQAIVSM